MAKQLLDAATYVHAKESCYMCGKAGPVVDTEVEIEGEGGLVLCTGCIFDLAIAAGYVMEVNQAATIEEARAAEKRWQERAEKAEDALSAGVSASAERLRDIANTP